MNDKLCWTFLRKYYIKSAIINTKDRVACSKRKLRTKVDTQMSQNYNSELYSSPLSSPHEITNFQEFIGILHWTIELGCMDILHEVSILSAYQAAPSQEHMK